MNRNKKSITIFALTMALTFILGITTALVLFNLSTQHDMAVTTTSDLELWYSGGQITTFDWGNFNPTTPSRIEDFELRYYGSGEPQNCTWEVSNLPLGFSFDINYTSYLFTAYGEIFPIEMSLILVDLDKPSGNYDFLCNFTLSDIL